MNIDSGILKFLKSLSGKSEPADTRLFVGQLNHPLTEKEKELFLRRLKLPNSLFSSDEYKKIRAAFNEMAKLPTGRKQLREIIRTEPQNRHFKIQVEENNRHATGVYDIENDVVTIPQATLENSKDLGITLLHELLHARHVGNQTLLFTDCETHALSVQLNAELNNSDGNTYDIIHARNYQKSLERWKRILNNQEEYPPWAQKMKFQYLPSKISSENTPEREQLARDMYIQQMASLDTRAKYMEDFYIPESSLAKEEISSEQFSYKQLYFRNRYYSADLKVHKFRPQLYKTGALSSPNADDISGIESLIKRNPALNKELMLEKEAQIMAELQKKALNPEDTDKNTFVDVLDNIPELTKELQDEFDSIRNNSSLSDSEREEKFFDFFLRNKEFYTPEQLEHLLSVCLAVHQQASPERNEIRDKMVERYEEATGREIPLGAIDEKNTNLLEGLRGNSSHVPLSTFELEYSQSPERIA